jgi:hypothetical protein
VQGLPLLYFDLDLELTWNLGFESVLSCEKYKCCLFTLPLDNYQLISEPSASFKGLTTQSDVGKRIPKDEGEGDGQQQQGEGGGEATIKK